MADSSASVLDASPADAFQAVRDGSDARIVDVRTRAEWSFVGIPDLTGTAGGDPILLEWQSYPSMEVAPAFGEALQQACPDKATTLYFLCRSGARSLAAARQAKALGYARCFNVVDGFEGPPDAEGHRGTVAGWKASGLPWRQS